MGAQKWFTTDAHGQMKCALLGTLLKTMHEKNDWTMASDVWKSALLPRHQLVLSRQKADILEVFYVLQCTEYGATCWPVVRRGKRYILLGWGKTRLDYRIITDENKLEVIPIQVVSPLHAYVEDDVELPHNGIMFTPGAPVDLMAWQAQHGFPGVTEHILKKLCEK